jgi:hypothetical protein
MRGIKNFSRSCGTTGKFGSIPRSDSFLTESTRRLSRAVRKRGQTGRFRLHCDRLFRLGPQKAAYSKGKNKNRAYLFHILIIGITKNKVKRIFFQTDAPLAKHRLT